MSVKPDVASLKPQVIDAVVAHARAARPAECCGMLLGSGSLIEEAKGARNISTRPTARFVVDPRDHLDAIRDGRRRGLDVVGFYHSHPCSPAEPSETDLAEATYFDHLYLIVSLASDPPEIRLFRLDHGGFLGLTITTVP
jgi:proteasome lid subunit RPN8/RPN11